MHETAIVAGLLRIVEEEASRHDVARVTRVRLQVGLLAAVEERTLTGCFAICAEGTVAEGAQLVVETVPLRCRCRACGRRMELERRVFLCPDCGAMELELFGGNELVIAALEVEPKEGGRTCPQNGPQPSDS
ncbi:hydrogenase maturation nickel metallochaperone HypA [Desulfocurvus sp.]|jgi:hydrogenase nickel incorporation protein HypA/HybF|uniref:hydrogenase maturation nickel metallochaperone HypA n=1 Tax=Desulfocurvus sp. TaxID=2871698 RepID=UPI0025C5A358|nr:hydrogenase maturation nickel metallochaperone HypA [Desulfocurvus sp.]MCK9240001.1 hydrogenase maturation nickel metallochaperone HypA [Desulfocurvus sp.]